MTFVKFFYIPDVTKNGVKIVSDSAEIIESLSLVFGQYVYNSCFLTNNINIDIKSTDYGYIVTTSTHKRFFKGIEKVLIFLGKILHSIAVSDSWLLLHGFVIGKTDVSEAVALVGASHSGKSTLGTYLLNNGYDYISDDLVIVNVNSLEIVPFTRPIHLRAPSIDALKNYSLNINVEKNKVLSQRSLYYHSGINQSTCSLRSIYFVKYGLPCSVVECSSDYVFDKLVENIFSIGNLPGSILNCKAIISRLEFYNLEYTDMNYARDQIMKTWK